MSEVDLSIRVAVPPIFTPTSVLVFGEAIRLASAGPGRAIVLEGSRGVFCRGLDIRHFAFRAEKEELLVFASALLALRHATKAVIAIVDGVALGEGIGLAAAADFVIATQDSTFGLPESTTGLASAIILPFLLERMRPQQARVWGLSPHSRSAAEAAQAGLVDILTTRDELDETTQYWIRQFASADHKSVLQVKRLTSAHDLEASVRDGLALATDMLRDQ